MKRLWSLDLAILRSPKTAKAFSKVIQNTEFLFYDESEHADSALKNLFGERLQILSLAKNGTYTLTLVNQPFLFYYGEPVGDVLDNTIVLLMKGEEREGNAARRTLQVEEGLVNA